MLARRRLRRIVALLSSAAVVVPAVYFLVKQGLDRAEKIASISFGLLGAAGLIANWLTTRPGKKPGTASPTESVPLGCLLHLRDDGQPPLVNQVDPLDLGVKPAIDTTDRHDQDLPPYVPRTGDDDLEWAIAEGGIVLLHGKAAAGKSRALPTCATPRAGRWWLDAPTVRSSSAASGSYPGGARHPAPTQADSRILCVTHILLLIWERRRPFRGFPQPP